MAQQSGRTLLQPLLWCSKQCPAVVAAAAVRGHRPECWAAGCRRRPVRTPGQGSLPSGPPRMLRCPQRRPATARGERAAQHSACVPLVAAAAAGAAANLKGPWAHLHLVNCLALCAARYEGLAGRLWRGPLVRRADDAVTLCLAGRRHQSAAAGGSGSGSGGGGGGSCAAAALQPPHLSVGRRLRSRGQRIGSSGSQAAHGAVRALGRVAQQAPPRVGRSQLELVLERGGN